jgi:hypothetical protein
MVGIRVGLGDAQRPLEVGAGASQGPLRQQHAAEVVDAIDDALTLGRLARR